jgi:hypothetical protein
VGLEGLEWLRKALFDKYLFDQEEEQQIRVKIGLQDTDIGRYNIIDIISYHYITFSRILIFLYHFLTDDIIVILYQNLGLCNF